MTYDAHDRILLLVVADPSTPRSAADGLRPALYFSFNGTAWTRLPLSAGPLYSSNGSLGYDSSDGLVLYEYPQAMAGGGWGTTTWTFRSGYWTPLIPGTSPPARNGAGLADDPSDNGALLFGGADPNNGTLRNDSWIFSADAWTRRVPVGPAPSPRTDGGMAWDSSLGRVVLIGGRDGAHMHPGLNDTWTFQAGNWSAVATPGPDLSINGSPDRILPVDDPGAGAFLGLTLWNSTPSGGAGWWNFTGSSWSPLPGTGVPLASPETAAAYDAVGSFLLEFPAFPTLLGTNGSGWKLSAGTWGSTVPIGPARGIGGALTFDAADGYALLAEGSGLPGDTWEYSASGWAPVSTNRTVPARSGAGMVYDAHDGYVLLFGGGRNDTWEFTHGGWTQITPAASPPVMPWSSMVYDGADGVVLWVGGNRSAYTWTYQAGNWTNQTGPGGPPGPPGNPLVYDSSDGYVLEQGPLRNLGGVPVPSNETWSFLDGSWTNRSVPGGAVPTPRTGASLSEVPLGRGVLLFGGRGTAGPELGDTWEFSAGSWTRFQGWPGPSPRTGMLAVWDPALNASLSFGGGTGAAAPSDGACAPAGASWTCNDTFLFSAAAGALPYLQTLVAVPPVVDLGAATTLTPIVSGGTGPLTYRYLGLPAGCTSRNGTPLRCVPSVAGGFTVLVAVSDSAGHATETGTPLNVTPALSLTLFNASPATVRVGERTLLSAQYAGGTGTVAFVYNGLPPGCSTQSVPTLPCIPTARGNYTVVVHAADTGGGQASQSFALHVLPAGPSTGPWINSFALRPDSLVLGNSTNLSVDASGGQAPLTYAYTGLPPGCSSANATNLTCLPGESGTFPVTFTVTDAGGRIAQADSNLTVYPAGGGGGALISGFSATPSELTLGDSTELSVTASGGTGPLTYAYPALPSGCTSANSSALFCTPDTAGSYLTYVLVTDSAGHRTGAFGSVLVRPLTGPGPEITLFSAAPSTVRLGNSTTFVLSVSGGVAPLTYQYAGLPDNCTVNGPVVHCTPSRAGDFQVTANVTDALGRSDYASATLHVLPAVAPVGGGSVEEPNGLGVLLTDDGALALCFVLAAAGILALTERAVRERRAREEGLALVEAMTTAPVEDPALD